MKNNEGHLLNLILFSHRIEQVIRIITKIGRLFVGLFVQNCDICIVRIE